ncbi:hypothetical protein WOC76_08285 [Methylocystis sp. IM3]|uniref:hypothetical protein n=1 Tax=unclassified Methylocystis TaxID=2625913 RepID=UPI0030F72FAC
MTKALICGGRNVGRTDPRVAGSQAGLELRKASAERMFVSKKMDELHQAKNFTLIIAGNEGGAERLGAQWGAANKVAVQLFERKKSSRESVMQRNTRMLDEAAPELVIAFGGGESTQALLVEANRRGVAVLEFALPKD